jgi:L-amino acid N-acyltransferase YncA
MFRDSAPEAVLTRPGRDDSKRVMSQAMPAPTLRLATEKDADGIQEIYAPYVRDTCISFETEPPSVEEIRRRVGSVLPRWPWLVCERDGEILAYAYASEHRVRAAFRWAVDVAVYVREGRQRLGLGRTLYSALIPLLRLQGYCHAYAAIYIPNPGSVALHEAMGFRPFAVFADVGYKQGGWRDVGWWHLALRELPVHPEEPLRLEQIRRLPEWERILGQGKPG